VYYLAVAAARALTDPAGCFQDERFMTAPGELARNGKPDNASSDHHRVGTVHVW
jgi:hypothetical protein